MMAVVDVEMMVDATGLQIGHVSNPNLARACWSTYYKMVSHALPRAVAVHTFTCTRILARLRVSLLNHASACATVCSSVSDRDYSVRLWSMGEPRAIPEAHRHRAVDPWWPAAAAAPEWGG